MNKKWAKGAERLAYSLAIDIGASSGRHILGSVRDGRLEIEEIYRFENRQRIIGSHVCWDIQSLWKSILDGLEACGSQGKAPATIGVDTWAVDFVLLDEADRLITDAVAYRDSRTQGMPEAVDAIISPQALYARTGIQRQAFNTIYQLMALRSENPNALERAHSLLMIPDYFHFLLTGVKRQEYTNASSTGLLDAAARTWDRALIDMLGLPQRLFGPLSMPGETVGRLKPEIAQAVGFQAEVVLPATHDTGSAFLAVPAADANAVYLSSGTWSLLGVESGAPITDEASRLQNFTNEGGAWGRYRYLKNIMGLWMIQSVRRELSGVPGADGRASPYADGKTWSFAQLIEAAMQAECFPSVVDVNSDGFLAPRSMIDAVREACERTGQLVPLSAGETMRCIYKSLANCYRDAIAGLQALTGRTYACIHIVGGGCQDDCLSRMTADATGIPVYAGPVEGTAIGNLLVQMIARGKIASLEEGRALVRRSFDVRTFEPRRNDT